MTQYSRSVVPGRGARLPAGRDLDRLVFGDAPPPGGAPARPQARPAAANEDQADADSGVEADAPDEAYDDDLPVRPFMDRAARDRRETKGRRRTDYSRLPDGAGFRQQEGGSSRGIVMLVAALVVVGVFGGVVWNAYRQGVRGDDMVAAPKLADDGPFKVRPAPEEPQESAGLDATVFERFEAPAKGAAAGSEGAAVAETRPPATAEPVEAPPVQPPAAASVPTPAPAARVQAEKPQPAKAEPAPVQAPKAAAPAPAVTAPPPAQAASTGAFSPGGKYLVQIGASASETGADEEWSRWKGKGGALFSGAEKIIVRADVGGRTVYRVRVGSFATAEAADSFCAAFKGKGGDCFRATR